MRLLAVVRLSDLTDETTSPERQRGKITTYAKLHDHEVVGVAEDLDVSGAVSPFDRPQLGPWLKRPDDWDGLIVAKYDRLTRSLLDFLVLYKWLSDRARRSFGSIRRWTSRRRLARPWPTC
jgi:site-specific DNA recombinase